MSTIKYVAVTLLVSCAMVVIYFASLHAIEEEQAAAKTISDTTFFENADCARLHFHFRISRELVFGDDSRSRDNPLIIALGQIDGVKNVNLDKYEVFIEKGHLYEWSEILDQARQIVKEACH